jgi:peptide/nickel transport system permease protein
MTALISDVEPVAVPAADRRRPRLNGRLRTGLGLLALIVLLAIFVPLLSRYNADQITASDALKGPSGAHWLGADNFGRDQFVRMAEGYRISLAAAVGSVLVGLALGVPLGLLAGYAGGLADNVVMRPLDVLMAFPAVLLAITVMAIFGSGLGVLIVAIGIVYVPILARVMRASTLETSQELYVEAARARGASGRRIVLRHVLPNSIGPVIVQASILFGIAVLLEAALSFVGIGIKPPTASLGVMLSEGRDFMATDAWIVAVPGAAIALLVLTFNLIGDGLHAWLDPRGRARLR